MCYLSSFFFVEKKCNENAFCISGFRAVGEQRDALRVADVPGRHSGHAAPHIPQVGGSFLGGKFHQIQTLKTPIGCPRDSASNGGGPIESLP